MSEEVSSGPEPCNFCAAQEQRQKVMKVREAAVLKGLPTQAESQVHLPSG